VFGADAPRAGDERKLSLTEQYILQTTVGTAVATVLRRVFAIFFGSRTDLDLMRMEHSPRLVPDALQPSEQLVTAGVKCVVGQAGTGAIDIGLPLSIILQVRTRLVPPKAAKADARRPEDRARVLLSGAQMQLEAILGHKMIPLSEVRTLAPGSIILLQKVAGGVARAELQCGGRVLFEGTVVQHRGWNRFLIRSQGESDGDSGDIDQPN
jgi:flagellar motor switch protein FliM